MRNNEYAFEEPTTGGLTLHAGCWSPNETTDEDDDEDDDLDLDIDDEDEDDED